MVTPLDAMTMMWSAIVRTSKSGVVIGPDERVDRMTALHAMTTVPAWQHREEKHAHPGLSRCRAAAIHARD
jgi:predicted amidohydrolase YtcJ